MIDKPCEKIKQLTIVWTSGMIRAVLSLSQTVPPGVMRKQKNMHITDYFPSIEQLESFTTKDLTRLFRFLYPSSNLNKYSRSFLLGNLAWHIQVLQSGADPSAIRKRIVKRIERTNSNQRPRYLAGTRLVREWQGVTHEVIVEEKGYRWQHKQYRSLSHIARQITGAHWSGPRFFGLSSPAPPEINNPSEGGLS